MSRASTTPPSSPPQIRQRGLRALTALAHDLDLGPVPLEVLSDRGSLMVRLGEAGVVARVCTHTGAQRLDPGWWLGLEVTVGGLAHAAGAPVVTPAPNAGPHQVDGFWITLWTDMGDQTRRATPQESAAALAAWHQRLRHVGGELPVLTVAHQVITEPLEYAVRHGLLDRASYLALTREHEQALAGVEHLGTEQVLLHGDAHRGNLLQDQAGTWRWGDLEEACRGPIEWDLAVLGSTPDEQTGGAALTAYCRLTGRAVPAPEDLAPWLRLRTLEGTAWLIGCAVTFPERYAAPARQYLDQILNTSPAER